MQLIVAFKEPTRLMLLVIPQSPRRILHRMPYTFGADAVQLRVRLGRDELSIT